MSEKTMESIRKRVLRPDGNLTIYEAGGLRETLLAALEDVDLLEIDVRDIRECDTSGLQILCSAKKTADSRGTQITFTGISGRFENAMIKTGITYEMISRNGGTGCQR
jgi:anti-anti-sigma regulatory factor